MLKTAVITGITGQGGSYLTEILLDNNYKVYGVKRRSSTNTTERISHLLDNPNLKIVEGDLTDPTSMSGIINEYKPDTCINLAAQSHVATSFEQPTTTFETDTIGVLNLLEGIRRHSPKTRFVQASTSEMFGDNYDESYENKYQNEDTKFNPQSPYAIAKLAAHHLVGLYRKSYGLHASCAIMFNNESPRRGELFVTRKITKWIADAVKWYEEHPTIFENAQLSAWENMDPDYLYQGLAGSPRFPKLRLGNLDAIRDWGHCKDTMQAIWVMSQQKKPDDYVIATGKSHTIREFLDEAFKVVDIKNWSGLVVIDPQYYRPSEVEFLKGDASKAKNKLGWEPKISFKELVKEMVESDVEKLQLPKVQGVQEKSLS